MAAILTPTEHDRHIADLRVRLATEEWAIRDELLDVLAGVLPATAGMPEASVITDTEVAFVLGSTLLVASWVENDGLLTTEFLTIVGTPLTIVWNAQWLAAYDPGGSVDVPEDRPMTVTVQAPSGSAQVLPFDAAWDNPIGCINFVSTLIQKAHGFRPGIATGYPASGQQPWKR